MAVSSELDQWKREIYIVWYVGESLSVFGFCLLLMTACIFPTWRRSDQSKAWIQLCFAYLLFTLIYVNFKDFNECMSPALIVVLIYVGQATFCWMLAVAWLAHERLVVVFSDDDRGYMLRASLFSWLAPLPCDFLRLALDLTEYPDVLFIETRVKMKVGTFKMSLMNMVRFIDFLKDVGMYLPVITPIICSVGVYGYVLSVLCRNRQMWSGRQDLYGTAAISILFIMMSGVQFMFVVLNRFFTFTRADLFLAFLITSKVFINSVLFIFAIKKTRLMWWAYIRLKCCRVLEDER